MTSAPTPQQRDLVRAEAEGVVERMADAAPWTTQHRYRQMARGTLAALDWLEGRTDRTPVTGDALPAGATVPTRDGTPVPVIAREISTAHGWGSGHEQPPREDMQYHGAAWALMLWWEAPDDSTRLLAIDVPGVTAA